MQVQHGDDIRTNVIVELGEASDRFCVECRGSKYCTAGAYKE